MGTSRNEGRDESTPSKNSSAVFLLGAIADTTWRMFGPVIVGALLGWWFDNSNNTKYGALIGSIIGLVLAGLLVWKQYRDVTGDKK